MVKFNPKSQPDKYKLSEFTQPGQRKAVIKIDTDDDYMFQVTDRQGSAIRWSLGCVNSPEGARRRGSRNLGPTF